MVFRGRLLAGLPGMTARSQLGDSTIRWTLTFAGFREGSPASAAMTPRRFHAIYAYAKGSNMSMWNSLARVVLVAAAILLPRAAGAQGPVWTLDFPSTGVAAATVRSQAALMARVRLYGSAAPAGGLTLALTSSDPRILAMPPSVTVSAGRSEAIFEIRAAEVSAPIGITVNATGGGRTQAANVTIIPAPGSAQAGARAAGGAASGAAGAAAGGASSGLGGLKGGAAPAHDGAAGAAAGGANSGLGGLKGGPAVALGGAATSAAWSGIVTPPNAVAGKPASFVIQARTQANARRTSGGDVFVAWLSGPQAAAVCITDAGDGTYVGSFTVNSAGAYELHVLLMGVPIGGDPFAVSVR